MNLNQLEVLVAIVATGSLTEAGERIGLTQSAVSYSLSKLEAELGVQLLERGRLGIEITPIGEDVLIHARAILAQVEVIRQKTGRARGLAIGKLRFGCVPHVSPRLLTGILRSFQTDYPDIDIVVFEGKPIELISWLREGIVDVATVILPEQFPASTPLARDQVHVIVSARHRLAAQQRITLAQLDKESLIAPQEQYEMITALPQMQAVSLPRLRYAVSGYQTIFAMVRENMGISLMPGKVLTPDIDGIVGIPLSPTLSVDIHIAANMASPATDAFLACASRWSLEHGFLPTEMADLATDYTD
ncbi:LysR family transcriptional regulator [bacterium]|nr:LysR family transcriptional regulator [bacterium]